MENSYGFVNINQIDGNINSNVIPNYSHLIDNTNINQNNAILNKFQYSTQFQILGNIHNNNQTQDKLAKFYYIQNQNNFEITQNNHQQLNNSNKNSLQNLQINNENLSINNFSSDKTNLEIGNNLNNSKENQNFKHIQNNYQNQINFNEPNNIKVENCLQNPNNINMKQNPKIKNNLNYRIERQNINIMKNQVINPNISNKSNDINTQNCLNDPNIIKNDNNILIPPKQNNNSINSENRIQELTKEEMEKSKENGFILIGKTGVGKTSLLNVILGYSAGKVGYSSKSETNKSNFYCFKEEINSKINYYCIIDTPGLYDTKGKEADKNQKLEIIKLVSEKNIKIKGLLFLSNFQNERFDASEQLSLIEYNAIFPLKEFWKRIILIFTHYYEDPNGDSKEDIQKRADKNLSEIFNVIMNRIKNVSDPIKYNKINKKYINTYSRAKKKIQIDNNIKIRNMIIEDIRKYSEFTPMFTKVQIYNFEKYELQLNDKNLYDCDFYVYLDANNKVVHEEFKILKTYPKNNDLIREKKVNLNFENCEINEQGNLVKKTSKKETFMNLLDKYKGEGLSVISVIGSILSGIFFLPTLPICLATLVGGTYLIQDKEDKKNNNSIKSDKVILDKKIIDDIKLNIFNNP